MTDRLKRFSLLLLSLLLFTGCSGAAEVPPEQTADTSSEQLTAKVTGGLIRRDPETVKSIKDTASTVLAPGSGHTLRLKVTKSRYRLDAFSDEQRIKTYAVALGGNPIGTKTREGDERTPEGEYLMIPHHPSPAFGGCFYICYPNGFDAERGRAEERISAATLEKITGCLRQKKKPPHNTSLGGLILLHGTKQRWVPGLTTTNWTLGCIAMENDDLLELLAAYSPDDRPTLTILP